MSATADPRLTITWSHIDIYRHSFPASVIAEATGLSVEELLAAPAMLFGAVNPATAQLLKAAQNDTVRQAPTEFEIISAQASDELTLTELFDLVRRLIREEMDSGSPADRSLAALIGGLRREGLIV
ncbi:hypothetical protein Aca07nite_84370 [Actinoplanes capillaceus]|uniref:Uncharacterized protein n=1 Tax=Actinoplanes campanulatus TaxID=113559 RepID=A0ABQ3WXZ7_9ACTN|nr:hypothetical protein [Actinoplanes capillaceus]GID51162.1 hypothetical protein Aca07nite_84370 [Actinoplanes capillaceus]